MKDKIDWIKQALGDRPAEPGELEGRRAANGSDAWGGKVNLEQEIAQLRKSNAQLATAAIEGSDRQMRTDRLLRKAVALLKESSKGLPGVSDGAINAFLDLPEIREMTQ